MVERINKTIPQRTVGVGSIASKEIASNGGEYIVLKIFRSTQLIASTSDCRYFIRISDECKPILAEDMSRVAAEKQAFVWEEKIVRKTPITSANGEKLSKFKSDIFKSERVSDFVKEMPEEELLEYYLMSSNGYLTNLGIMWVGERKDRAVLHYAPSIQFIKYDENGNKVNKIIWDDY